MRKEDVVSTIKTFASKFDGDANHHFTSGHCAEFALSLAWYLNKVGVESSIDIYIRNEIDSETDEIDNTTFSHAIVSALGTELDIDGNELEVMPWDSRFDDGVDKWGLYNSWEILSFPFTTFDETVALIGPICDKYNVAYDTSKCMDYVRLLTKSNQKLIGS